MWMPQAAPNGSLPSKEDGMNLIQPATYGLGGLIHWMAWLHVRRCRGPIITPDAQPPADVSTRPAVHHGNDVSLNVYRFSGAKTVVAQRVSGSSAASASIFTGMVSRLSSFCGRTRLARWSGR